MKPLIRWVGGKTKLLQELRTHFPQEIKRYFEPFVGGGAVLLDIDPNVPALAADINSELINFYNVLKTTPSDLLREFRTFSNDETTYYSIRAWDRASDDSFALRSPLTRAARFLFLNKASFQGLWRVNRLGQHNVPFAHRKKLVCEDSDIAIVSNRLQNVDFMCEDFEKIIDMSSSGDFVYVDPPYIPTGTSEAFVGYTDGLFHYDDQVRLRDCLVRAGERGVKILASNSDTPISRELYKNFTIDTFMLKRLVSAKSSSRGYVTELIIKNF